MRRRDVRRLVAALRCPVDLEYGDIMTEEQGSEPATKQLEREIEFRGRKMWVKFPRPEVMLVWQRTLEMLQGPDVNSWNGAQVMKAIGRARNVIGSVIVHPGDQEWLDDEMLAERLELTDCVQLIQTTVDAFAQENKNREERRAETKTPKKASRRKVTV